ncbi:MAG: beta-eliminating lyase-related protein [Chloroflexota bacterium]
MGSNPSAPTIQPQPEAIATLTDDEIRVLRAACGRSLNGHGPRSAADAFAEISTLGAEDLEPDTYGDGGSVAVLETEVRALLGKPAAVFMPSGTMAQQIALRIHADRRNRRVIAFHPTCHLELHEDKAYQRLHALVGRSLGDGRELLTLSDLEAVHEPLAAVVFELPQREIGGRLPPWDALIAQIRHVRDHGAAVHLDGARLWEAGPFYDRPLSDIAELFDTVYVSLYKGLRGLAGSLLLGDEDVIAEAREWRRRHGGTLPSLWPYAAAGLAGLRLRLPRMAAYVAHAQAIAAELSIIEGVRVVPDPPQTPMMHLHLETTEEVLVAGVRRLATEEGLWTWGRSMPADTPSLRRIELTVGDATLKLPASEVAAAVRALLPA